MTDLEKLVEKATVDIDTHHYNTCIVDGGEFEGECVLDILEELARQAHALGVQQERARRSGIAHGCYSAEAKAEAAAIRERGQG